MRFIFGTCFGWILTCSMLHNKFMFCSTWIGETSGASLASCRVKISSSPHRHVHGFQKWSASPTGAKHSPEEGAWSSLRRVGGQRDQPGTAARCKPLFCWSQRLSGTPGGPGAAGGGRFGPLPWLLDFSTLSPFQMASWPHAFPPLCINTFTAEAHWALLWKITVCARWGDGHSGGLLKQKQEQNLCQTRC